MKYCISGIINAVNNLYNNCLIMQFIVNNTSWVSLCFWVLTLCCALLLYIDSFNTPQHPMKEAPLSSPFIRWRNCSKGRWTNSSETHSWTAVALGLNPGNLPWSVRPSVCSTRHSADNTSENQGWGGVCPTFLCWSLNPQHDGIWR